MKKNYLKLKIKLTVIVVLVLLLGCGMLTYERANQIRTSYTQQIYDKANFVTDLRRSDTEGSDEFICQAYYEICGVSRFSNVGFYTMLKDRETNETLVEDQNFVVIQKAETEGDEKEMRVLLLDDNFGNDIDEELSGQWEFTGGFFSKMELIGTCDDTYIYLDELKWTDMTEENDYSYVPEKTGVAQGKETVTFEEWAGTRYYGDAPIENKFYLYINSVCGLYDDWSDSMELNAEAKEICEQIYANILNDKITMDNQSKEGLFTCYVANVGYVSDEYRMPYVFVFHPVSIAIEELAGVFFVVAFVGFILITIIWAIIDKLYSQQLAYENNRRGLTRGIAHELKTPLAVTKGYVENWEYLDEKERSESAKLMVAEIDHMDKMVTDLLELSRLEAKAKQLTIEEVDIYALTKSVLGRMKSVIDERQLNVQMTPEDTAYKATKDMADSAYVVKADLEMMRVVLVNFISNAVKYAKESIDISLSEHKGRVRFTITNDGKVIESDKLDKVWEQFYKDDLSNNSRIESSGLGLAITKNILLLHEAKYGCESNIGKTTFWFELKI